MTDTQAWHALTVEPTLEPDLPICDPHHHLWQRGPDDKYLLADVLRDVDCGHNIVSTVFIEFRTQYRVDGPEELKRVGETEFVERIAAESASGKHGKTRIAAGIITSADLMLGAEVSKTLEAHMAASPRFRGIRHWLNWDAATDAMGLRSDAAPRLAFDPVFREGFRELGRRKLSFDAWIYFPQLPDLVELARAFPDVTIVLNHAGGLLGLGPYAARDEAYELWYRNMQALAACPNVSVKLGGLGVPRCGFGWHHRETPPGSLELASALSPYVLESIELFGADRCLFESNFPADKCGYGYGVIWNAYKRMARCCSAEERAKLFHDNAARIYRLG